MNFEGFFILKKMLMTKTFNPRCRKVGGFPMTFPKIKIFDKKKYLKDTFWADQDHGHVVGQTGLFLPFNGISHKGFQ
jgi:hypothetical protein